MKWLKQGFALFLLVDLTLMLLFWLTHLYMAYFSLKIGILAVINSLLMIIAELWRVVKISYACEHFTETVEQVIVKLEELSINNEHDRRVSSSQIHDLP